MQKPNRVPKSARLKIITFHRADGSTGANTGRCLYPFPHMDIVGDVFTVNTSDCWPPANVVEMARSYSKSMGCWFRVERVMGPDYDYLRVTHHLQADRQRLRANLAVPKPVVTYRQRLAAIEPGETLVLRRHEYDGILLAREVRLFPDLRMTRAYGIASVTRSMPVTDGNQSVTRNSYD